MSISEERVARFDAYRETLSKDERAELDRMVVECCDTFRRPGGQFGERMAKELIIALVDFNPRRQVVR
jgi:hypothetical protein